MTDSPVSDAYAGKAVGTKGQDVNFFRPSSAHTRANMRLIVTLFMVWVAAVFGFQFLLLALEKPTPEATYETFERVWPNVYRDAASDEEQRAFARVTLSVLGKNLAVSPEHREVLNQALTGTVLGLLPAEERPAFRSDHRSGKTAEAAERAVRALGLNNEGFERLMMALLPSSLSDVDTPVLRPSHKQAIPGIMSFYLIHNRSLLTDFRFLGFPFHYWYTAQFLLILFVLLCLVYAVQTDKIHARYGFVEE